MTTTNKFPLQTVAMEQLRSDNDQLRRVMTEHQQTAETLQARLETMAQERADLQKARDGLTDQEWKFMSCSHCEELCQRASWLLICYTRVNNQSEARSGS